MVFNKNRQNSAYLRATKYLNYLLRTMCIITRIPSDENTFATNNRGDRYFMLEWMYTAIFYTFSCFIFYRLIYTESILKPYLDDLTLDNINYALMTSLSILIVLLNPLLASKARENREKYFKLWREYQIQYEQYTVSELNLGSSILIVLLIVSGTIVTTLELVTNCVLTSQVKPTYVYANGLIYFYTNLTTIQWVTDCHLLTIASKKLLNQFLVGFKTNIAIQSIACNNFSLETQEQIFTALKTIQSHIPVITVKGYFTMDRTYILSYLGVAVSYIIVLAQFKIGTS
ncbi:unnamed protein product [Aphis gossypii]|uniref:Gustatory receptor n=1 Tax=Aphis gossypii TaxID=80765 RepID=A0A9P0J1P5_APHGO|nr:unnamed protein product [Aphis gossypii]